MSNDPFKASSGRPNYAPRKAVVIDVSTADHVLDTVSKKLYVGAAGDVTVIMADDNSPVLLKAMPLGMYDLQIKAVAKSGTASTSLVALF